MSTKIRVWSDYVRRIEGVRHAAVHFAVDRHAAAGWGFDYRAGYASERTDRLSLAATPCPLPSTERWSPITTYIEMHHSDSSTRS